LKVNEFIQKFGINTIAINEDTPNCQALWKVSVVVTRLQAISTGGIPHLIVQPEQFSVLHGHLPKMARLLHDQAFVKKVGGVSVDECHNIHTAGSTVNGRAAFRPSRGTLGHLRTRLPKETSWQFLSATVPLHIYKDIEEKLAIGPNPTIIRVSTNRPNLIFVTHILVGGRSNLCNLDIIIPPNFHPPMRLPKLVIFHDNKAETQAASQYLNSRLPTAFQSLGICRHYHADMSPEYLEDVYSSFSADDGNALILNATSGAGEGLDVRGINGVINYGIVANIPMKCQRDGRAGRSTVDEAFCISMVEPWVPQTDLSNSPIDPNDPDRPLSDAGITKKNPTKQERTGRAAIHFATSDKCQRILLAEYYQDRTAEALEYTGRWCCDSNDHLGNTFALERIFLGPVYVEPMIKAVKRKRKTTVYRPKKERPELEKLLVKWRTDAHANFTLRFLRPPTFILDASGLKTLCMARRALITSARSITSLLKQSDEWGNMWAQGIFDIIAKYKPSAVAAEDGDEESDEEEPRSKRR
ncbi:P-loop containing nucleoside triphosphate hydrolase protein, partial [Mycena epipterygia]